MPKSKMVVFWIFWLTSLPFSRGAQQLFSDDQMDIVLALADHFKVSSCLIGKNEEPMVPPLLPKELSLSKRRLLTGWLTFSEISELLGVGSEWASAFGRTMVVVKVDSESVSSLRQFSDSSVLSSAILVAFSDSTFLLDLFRHVYIPFDSEFLYISEENSAYSITELYQVKNDLPVETFDLGRWTREDGLVLVNSSFYSRRNSLKGCTLTGIIKNNPPYVSVTEGEEGKSIFSGYLYEIWTELEYRINFSTEFSKDYFDKKPEEVLEKGEVDFAVARISNEPSAFHFMDFSLPIDEAKFYMFGHRPGTELDWDSYLKPFSPNTWFVNLAWMISSSLALAVLYKVAWNFGTSEKEANYFIFTFSESLLTVFRAICMQGSDVTPRSNSCRLLFLSIYLTALVVTSAFSAALFSLLTIPKPRSPFNSLEEVLKNKRYRISVPSNPTFQKLVEDFSGTLPLSTQLHLLERILNPDESSALTPEQELQRLCEDKMYVLLFDLPNVLHLMQNMTRSCQDKILPSGQPLFTEFIGFGFSKRNSYKRLINFHLIRMKNEGILNRLLLNYWPPQIPTVQATWVRVTLADISPILYMFALGAVLGTVLLYGEKTLLHLRKRQKKMRSNSLGKVVQQKIVLSNHPKKKLGNVFRES